MGQRSRWTLKALSNHAAAHAGPAGAPALHAEAAEAAAAAVTPDGGEAASTAAAPGNA